MFNEACFIWAILKQINLSAHPYTTASLILLVLRQIFPDFARRENSNFVDPIFGKTNRILLVSDARDFPQSCPKFLKKVLKGKKEVLFVTKVSQKVLKLTKSFLFLPSFFSV